MFKMMRDSMRSFRGLARTAVLGMLVIGVTLGFSHSKAQASGVLIAAAQSADGGLAACGSLQGKQLYECVANVIDKLSYEVAPANVPATRSALSSAASGLRAAATKAQALSAIRQCQSVISSALAQVRASGGLYVPGWGDTGLSAISGVLARAAKLVQTKG